MPCFKNTKQCLKTNGLSLNKIPLHHHAIKSHNKIKRGYAYVFNVYTDIKIYVYSTLTSARHLTKYFNSCMFIIGKDFYVKAKGGLLCVCNE